MRIQIRVFYASYEDQSFRFDAIGSTVTTKSRLRALGANVYTKNHVTYLNGEAI